MGVPRAERLAQIEALLAEGLTHRQIGERLGITRSAVRNVLNDPDGSKQRARRDSYSGICERCGGETRSDGTSTPSPICDLCARKLAAEGKQWTPGVVIDAIRRFAAEHGRPPSADEWITADRDNGYPPRSSIYRPGGPFASWADAIEAAGFPRPTSGRRTFKEVRMSNQPRNAYVVLRENDDGTWEVIATPEVHSPVLALNAALNGHEASGRWVAVPGRYWRPRGLKPKTIYDWIEDTEPVTASSPIKESV